MNTNRGCRPLTDDEIERLIAGMAGSRWQFRDSCLLNLGLRSGFRVSELLSLKTSDVYSYEDREVRRSVTVMKENMKGGKNKKIRIESRTTPLHEAAREAILLWLRHSHMDNPIYAQTGTALFPRQGSLEPISAARAWGIIQEAGLRGGVALERLGTHSWRKSYALKMWSHPAIHGDWARMSRLMSHKNPSNTLRYLEFLDGSLEAAVLA